MTWGMLKGDTVVEFAFDPKHPERMLEFNDYMGSTDRRIGLDAVEDAEVSTVFLGIDHGFGGPPLWFETVIFGGKHDGEMWRYTTKAQSIEGHRRVVECLRDGRSPV